MTNREAYERDCEELEQYRNIGTVEYFKKLKLADNGTIWGFIDEYVAYKNIGTVEECREAVEKQKAQARNESVVGKIPISGKKVRENNGCD